MIKFMIFEAKKLMRDRVFVFLMFSVIIFVGFRMFKIRKAFTDRDSIKFYDELPPEPDRVDYDALKNETEKLIDMKFSTGTDSKINTYIYSGALKNLEFLYGYEKSMHAYLSDLVRNAAIEGSFEDRDHKEKERLLRKQIKYYNRVRNLKLIDSKSYVGFLGMFHKSDMNTDISLAMLFLVLAVSVIVFQRDYYTGCADMVKASAFGGRKNRLIKLLAVYIFIFLLTLTEFLFEMVVARFCFGVKEYDAAIQSLEEYKFNPFGVSVLTYIIICCVFRMAVLFFAASVAGLLCVKSKGIMLPLFLSILINIVLPMTVMDKYLNLAQSSRMTALRADALRCFVPHCLLVPDYYFKMFDSVNIAGFNLFRFVPCISVCFLFVAISGLLFIFFKDRDRR